MPPIALCTKTRLHNATPSTRLIRWIQGGGMTLKPGETVLVDGIYPSEAVELFQSNARYDIENGLIGIEIVTNIPTRHPTPQESSDCRSQPGLANAKRRIQRPPEDAIKPVSDTKVDERWGRPGAGGIDDMKPKAVTLPGHEDTLDDKGPETSVIFDEGPSIETPAPVETPSPVETPAPVETKKPRGRRPRKTT